MLIGNFVENAAKTTGRMGETILSHTGPGAQTGIPTTTQKRSYTAEVRPLASPGVPPASHTTPFTQTNAPTYEGQRPAPAKFQRVPEHW